MRPSASVCARRQWTAGSTDGGKRLSRRDGMAKGSSGCRSAGRHSSWGRGDRRRAVGGSRGRRQTRRRRRRPTEGQRSQRGQEAAPWGSRGAKGVPRTRRRRRAGAAGPPGSSPAARLARARSRRMMPRASWSPPLAEPSTDGVLLEASVDRLRILTRLRKLVPAHSIERPKATGGSRRGKRQHCGFGCQITIVVGT